MFRPIRIGVTLVALVLSSPQISTGLEARAHVEAQAQEITAQQQADDSTEFLNYMMKRAEDHRTQLKGNPDNKKESSNAVLYEKLLALYRPFLDEIFQRHGIRVKSSDVLNSKNLIIYTMSRSSWARWHNHK